MREIGCLYFLLGSHIKASEVFSNAIKLNEKDWASLKILFKGLEEFF